MGYFISREQDRNNQIFWKHLKLRECVSILAPIKVTAPSPPSTLVVPGEDRDDQSVYKGSKEGGSGDGSDVHEHGG